MQDYCLDVSNKPFYKRGKALPRGTFFRTSKMTLMLTWRLYYGGAVITSITYGIGKFMHISGTSSSLLRSLSFFCSFVTQVNKIKYGKNWRNKERKNEPSKKKELPFLSCFLFSFFAPPILPVTKQKKEGLRRRLDEQAIEN